MSQTQNMRERYRRTLATAGAVVALATAACGSAVAGSSGPANTPVTTDSVRAAVDHSTMKSAHFKVHGTMIVKRNYLPVTGDGVIQITPREAFRMNLSVQTYTSAGVLKFQAVTIGGRDYTRLGTGAWTSKPSKNSPTKFTSYMGEEILAGTSVWHARAATAGSTFDIWVRESDGYVVQLLFSSTTGDFTMAFDSYNKSPVITKP
jgi:hypothetical protein